MKTFTLLCGLLLLVACNGSSPSDGNGSGGPNEPNPNEQPR